MHNVINETPGATKFDLRLLDGKRSGTIFHGPASFFLDKPSTGLDFVSTLSNHGSALSLLIA
jgi:hypothetical protein